MTVIAAFFPGKNYLNMTALNERFFFFPCRMLPSGRSQPTFSLGFLLLAQGLLKRAKRYFKWRENRVSLHLYVNELLMFTCYSKKSVFVLNRKENEKDQKTNPQCSLVTDEVKVELSFLSEKKEGKIWASITKHFDLLSIFKVSYFSLLEILKVNFSLRSRWQISSPIFFPLHPHRILHGPSCFQRQLVEVKIDQVCIKGDISPKLKIWCLSVLKVSLQWLQTSN